MSSRYTDTVYDPNSPTQQNRRAGKGGPDDPYVSSSGFVSNEERLTSQALASALSVPADVLRNTPPQRGPLFPARFIGKRTQPTLSDCITMNRLYPDSSAEFSGSSGSYAGTATPAIGLG